MLFLGRARTPPNDSAGRAVSNAFVRAGPAIFISPIGLCPGARALGFCYRKQPTVLNGMLHLCRQLFFADRDLSGHGTACAGDRNQDDYPQKMCAKRCMIHSAVAAAKSIPSPTRCLTSVSHALG